MIASKFGPAEIAAARLAVGQGRAQVDGALGLAMQLLDRLEAQWREAQRDERLSNSERQSLGAAE
jgi:hypothetical protein